MNASANELKSSTVPPDPFPVGFGKYRLLKHLAAGGMAQIFLAAIDGPQGFQKTCVIKRILPQFAALPDFAEMFVTEAKVAALLNHPNIVQVFDFGTVDDQYYLAMEYVEGTSLNGLMRAAAKARVALGPRLAVHLGIPLCDALAYVQSMRLPSGEPMSIVHRDVTPGNVLISNTAEVKLTDFGVVKTSLSPGSTSAGVLKGKFAYMSPEQVNHQPLDHRSDIFSLGVVLYELATGHRLFKRSSIAEMLSAVSAAEVPLPSELVPDFPVGVERVLLKALAADPEQRYQSAREMLAELDAFRLEQRWTSGRRELAGLMVQLFPNAAHPASVDASWPGRTKTPTPAVSNTVPMRRPAASALSTPGPTAATRSESEEAPWSEVSFEELSLPGISIEDDGPARRWWETPWAMGAAAMAATAGFWWLVLS